MTSRPPTSEPEPEPEQLPTALQCREIHAIVNRQISEPAPLTAYIGQIVEALEGISGCGPHDLTSEESELFATLYQAISNDSAAKSESSAEAHLIVVKIITKTLGIESENLMDQTFGPNLTLYAHSLQSIPGQAVSHFLREIHKCLVNNKHADSFGSLFNVGISTNTKVICCVFGSRTPEKFTAPTELVYEGISMPVLIIRNWISDSATSNSLPSSWINKPVCQPVKIDLSGQSVGQQGDVNMAGSFGFYGDAQGALYGFTAAHCTPQAEQGSIIVSPSARELTGRLQNAANYTKFVPSPVKRIDRLESEVQSLLENGLREDSKDGCEILETLETGEVRKRKIVLNGPEFGRVIGTCATHKSGVLGKHNHLLDQQGAKNFDLPFDGAGLGEEVGREGCSRIEWCCFELSRERFGGNRLNSDTNQNDVVRGIDLLKPDMEVSKIGRTTGQTRGTVNGCIVQRWSDQPEKPVTMEIAVLGDDGKSFAAYGDSGSLVTTGEVAPYGVGMVIGKDRSDTLVLVTPLWAVLEDVAVRLHLGIDFYTEMK